MTYRVRYEFQDISGSWVPAGNSDETNPVAVSARLRELKRSYPEKRCRAVDENGRLVDILD
jgi:hypothetical protein